MLLRKGVALVVRVLGGSVIELDTDRLAADDDPLYRHAALPAVPASGPRGLRPEVALALLAGDAAYSLRSVPVIEALLKTQPGNSLQLYHFPSGTLGSTTTGICVYFQG